MGKPLVSRSDREAWLLKHWDLVELLDVYQLAAKMRAVGLYSDKTECVEFSVRKLKESIQIKRFNKFKKLDDALKNSISKRNNK